MPEKETKVKTLLTTFTLFVLSTSLPAFAADCPSLMPGSILPDRVLLLVAAGNLFDETGDIVEEALGPDWRIWPDRGTEERLSQGEEQLCSWLEALPKQEQGKKKRAINEWIEAYRAVETLTWLLDNEPLASAVAHTPDTRNAFPRDDDIILTLGPRVGETLASGEHPGLWYRLASDLAGASPSDRRGIVNDLLARGVEIYLKEYETR